MLVQVGITGRAVAVGVPVLVAVTVGVLVGVGVLVAVSVAVGGNVTVGVFVAGVGCVDVGDGVPVGVAVIVGVNEGRAVQVAGMVITTGGDGWQERTAAMMKRTRITRASRIVIVCFIVASQSGHRGRNLRHPGSVAGGCVPDGEIQNISLAECPDNTV